MLIIYPHWPPSNLVGVHRVRLIANELSQFGWKAHVLTVDERDYEEPLAPETVALVAPEVETTKVRARKPVAILGKRIVGDIGLRGWVALHREARKLLRQKPFDFVWFSMPSWYPSLMGCSLSKEFKVPFGLDYQDPWVHAIPEEEKGFNRATFTIALAKILEPLALRRVSLISGVSHGYIHGTLSRNPIAARVPSVIFQVGFRSADHDIQLPDYLPPLESDKETYVYAGAHWAMGHPLFREFMLALSLAKKSGQLAKNVQFLFIGTGNPNLPSLSSLANELQLGTTFREHPAKISYLEVQQTLRSCAGSVVLGSTEPHYSASKIFQCLLTSPRTMGYFHHESAGMGILRECKADTFSLGYDPKMSRDQRIESLCEAMLRFVNASEPWKPNLKALERHSSSSNACKLIQAVEQLCQ